MRTDAHKADKYESALCRITPHYADTVPPMPANSERLLGRLEGLALASLMIESCANIDPVTGSELADSVERAGAVLLRQHVRHTFPVVAGVMPHLEEMA